MAPSVVFRPLLAFCAFFCLGVQADTCYDDYYYYGYSSYKYCEYGCCGSECCEDHIFTIAAIIGIVIGCIVVIGVIIAVVCCCIKTKGQSGRVVQPQGQPTNPHVTLVYAGTGGSQSQPGPAYGMYPMGGQCQSQPGPAYGMQPMGPQPVPPFPPNNKGMEPPPAYSYSEPAYPPGAVPGGSNPSGTNSGPLAPPPTGLNTA